MLGAGRRKKKGYKEPELNKTKRREGKRCQNLKKKEIGKMRRS